MRSTDLKAGPAPTLSGSDAFKAANLTIKDPNARVSTIILSLEDIQAINGIVHINDKVILPE